MGALDYLKHWLDLLAGVGMAWRDAAKGRRTFVVVPTASELVIRPPGAEQAAVPLGAKLPDALLRGAHGGFVVLELPPDRVVRRLLTLPAQARAFLGGIVQNQIERLSPWKADQAAYGFAAEAAEAGASLAVTVLIASRAAMDASRQLAADAGLVVDRIVARDPTDPAAAPVPLWSRTADGSAAMLRRARLASGAAVLAIVAASVGASAWAVISAGAASAKSQALGGRVKTLQRQAIAPAGIPVAAGSPERVWAWKAGAPSAVVLIEALSSALPDTAYLTEFTLQGTTLRLVGQAADAPALIQALERSGHLADVRFFAPTTRAADGTRFRFHIEARVQPRLEVAER
jgi:general secretion pathway protein L